MAPTNRFLITASPNTFVHLNSNIWHADAAEGAGDGGGLPVDDYAVMVNSSGATFTIGGAMACARLTMGDWGGAAAVNADVDVNGDAIFDESEAGPVLTGASDFYVLGGINWLTPDASAFTGKIIWDGTAGKNLTVYAASTQMPLIEVAGSDRLTVVLDGAATELPCKGLVLTSGAFTDGGALILAAGDMAIANMTVSLTGVWRQIDDGDLDVHYNMTPAHLQVAWTAGKTSTLVGSTHAKKITLGDGILTSGVSGKELSCRFPTSDGFLGLGNANLTDDGGFFPRLAIYLDASRSNGEIVVASGQAESLYVMPRDGIKLTMTGPVNIGTSPLKVYADAAAATGEMDMDDQNLTAGVVTLGRSGFADRVGKASLGSGTWQVTSIARDGATGVGILHLGNGRGSGDVDGDGLTVTADSAVLTGRDTVKNVDCTGRLIAWGSKNGGGNSKDVEFAPRTLLIGMAA